MAGIAWNDGSADSGGGTEQMGRRLERSLPADLLDRFQIHLTRVEPMEPGKVQILWCHVHHLEPGVAYLANDGWRKFRLIVFVSNWQAREFNRHFGIPWSRCVVLRNGIEPLDVSTDHCAAVPGDRPIRLIYTSVPVRGLLTLYPVIKKIAEQRDDVELDVFSSFRLYGWEDLGWEQLFEALERIPGVTWHGAVPNEQVRKALADSHVYVYPSAFLETSCLALMEAMSAGLACVHPNLGGLGETAGGRTLMYQWQEDPTAHAVACYQHLMWTINALRAGDERLRSSLVAQKAYADAQYDWDQRVPQWEALLRSLLTLRPRVTAE